MPRISSTSSITGTGFMKWMPMNRSGRSVAEASRVIEIDEVLEATSASGFEDGAEIVEDLALDLFVLGRGLDDEVAVGQARRGLGGRDALERRPAVVLGDELAWRPAAPDCR